MRKVFDNIYTECAECGTPLSGFELHRKGERYYCSADFERLSNEEKRMNQIIHDDSVFAKKVLGTDYLNLTDNHDFTNWTATNATATAKVWTATGTTGKISKDLDLEFGQWYKIKVTASPSAGTIVCYNSTDGTKQLGTNNIEDVFVALTQYIEFRNLTASENTISYIEIRKM